MELFTINRYTDDKPKTGSKNEEEILEKLLQKVEKRKRKQKSEENVNDTDDNQKRKKKKSIKDVETENSETGEPPLKESGKSTDFNDGKEVPPKLDIDPTQGDESQKEHSGYKVLGEDADAAKREKVNVVLPAWLEHPTIISTSIATENTKDSSQATSDAIESFAFLAPHIRHSLKELNVTTLFPVQKAVIPWILEAHERPSPFRPRDVCVSAPTGGGKTLAFAIPVVQLLANRVERKIRALVVLPVTELAVQVFKVFKKLCEKTDLAVGLLSKQVPLAAEQEKLVKLYREKYYSKVDIIVTTPGRLVDHINGTKGFCLKSLKFLVIDEADRIMDAAYQNWLFHVESHVRRKSEQFIKGGRIPLCYHELQRTVDMQPQKLLFSATLSQDPEKLQSLHLFHPKLFTSVLTNLNELRETFAKSSNGIENETNGEKLSSGEFIGKYTTPAELTEKYCITESRLKPLTLFSLITENGWSKFLCFTNSAESAGRLAFVLLKLCEHKLNISELSSSLTTNQRAKVLSQFSRNKINGLICSDALARGIDIPDVDIVISYDPPRHIKTYIHRIGRTARAGKPGTAITLLTQKELEIFNQTLSEVGKTITEEITVSTIMEEKYAKEYSLALEGLRDKLEKDKRTKILLKDRAKHNTLQQKDPTKMTLMEKLQMQVNEETLQKMENDDQKEKKAPLPKQIGRKKFNASAGKNKEIQK